MANPVVTVTNSIPVPPDPTVARKTFTRIVYESQRFYMYSEGENYTTFDPIGKGERFFMTLTMDEAWSFTPHPGAGYPRPPFITEDAWNSLSESPSVFVNAVKSVMPNMVIPSTVLPENGYKSMTPTLSGKSPAYWVVDPSLGGAGNKLHLFNWELLEFNGVALTKPEANEYISWGGFSGINHNTVHAKDDKEDKNILKMILEEPEAPKPDGDDYLWKNSEPLVVTGAFVLLLNVIPGRPGTAEPHLTSQRGWRFNVSFGEVTMRMVDSGEMRVRVGAGADVDDEKNWVTVNLMEGRTKGGPVQQEHIQGKYPYIIVVYPVWNGIVIASGVQEARTSAFEITTTQAASVYVPKHKDAAVMEEPWSEGFDPTAPDEVFVWSSDTEVRGGDMSPLDPEDNTVVDFGNDMTIFARNCKFDISYIPVFFSPVGYFDEWFLASDDIPGELEITYDVYPIWTTNDTAMELATPAVRDSGIAPPEPVDTHYNYILWDLEELPDYLFARRTGELFGSIIEITETRESPIANDNGAFVLSWTPVGLPGDPATSGDWHDYLQSLSVSVSTSGSSGSLTVDKYGVAGQDSVPTQDVGAVVLEMTGLPDGTVGGHIFYGLGMGIADSKSSQGATWTVPLIGLEKKMDDIALIHVPFMDGEPLGVVIDFLMQYAGLESDTAAANVLIDLSASEDVNVARFDWTAGTTVRTALDEVMEDVNHHYVVRDGKVYFYELGVTGLPLVLGPDWEPSYPNTKVVTDDQSPEFENLRNKIVIMGLQAVYQGEGPKIDDPPAVLRMESRNNVTTPVIPWEKALVEGMPGYVKDDELSDLADRRQAQSSFYITIGRTSIPGNADIKPYDQWGSFVIHSVSHNVDFVGKTWTTDLEMSIT